MRIYNLVVFAAQAAIVAAKPVPDLQNRNVVQSLLCQAVSDVVSALTAYVSATPLCASFLSIPVTTYTTTSTSTL